jgi:hypothetical protein
MTVNGKAATNGRHDNTAHHDTANDSDESRTSCFFEWALLPHHQIESRMVCDLCKEDIKGEELDLKLHQISRHINPYYLSASDRILAQISSYAVQTDKTDGPWIPDWDNFKVIN